MEAKRGIYDITEICRFHGVETAVLCPGSRCAPLTLAFSRDKHIRALSIVDERSAAFVALGIAETTKRPVVLVCTSGSAVLNFGPAIAEAYYRHVPLLVLTADRPLRLVGQQDGQTMNQPNVFVNYSQGNFSLSGDISNEQELAYLHRTVNTALIKAKQNQGPVHVNITFEEPLYQLASQEKPARTIQHISTKETLNALFAQWKELKCMVLLGARQPHPAQNELLQDVAQKMPVLAESISNVAAGVFNANEIVRHIAAKKPEAFKADLLLTLGEGIVSKNLKAFLRKNPAAIHLHIDIQANPVDTYHQLTHIVSLDEETVLACLNEHFSGTTAQVDFFNTWKSADETIQSKLISASSGVAFSDFAAIYYMAQRIPSDVAIHVGNSMAVRYLNMMGKSIKGNPVFCNRGTSGIDGSISTALGNAIGLNQKVWALVGDLSFQYDGNALWNEYVPASFRVIVINNSGGGIFRLIDGPSSVPELVERFETRKQSSAQYKAAQFGLNYLACHTADELAQNWSYFVADSGKPCLLEIFTEPETNDSVFKFVQEQLSK